MDKKLSAAKAPSFDNPLLKFKEGLGAPAAKTGTAKKAFATKKAAAGAKAGPEPRPPRPEPVAAAAQRAAEAAREAGENAASLDFEAPDFSGVLDCTTTPSRPCPTTCWILRR